jgi:hypothetical protein
VPAVYGAGAGDLWQIWQGQGQAEAPGQDAPGKQARGADDRLGSIRNATRFRGAAAQTGDNGRGLPKGF